MAAQFSQPQDHALWRFGIISPLLHRSPDSPPLGVQIQDLARQVFFTPTGNQKRFCPDTIRDWLWRYRATGIDGLRPKPRRDSGSTSVPEPLQAALGLLRNSQPCWTVKRLLLTQRQQGLWDGRKPGRSALYRYCTSHHLTRAAAQPALPVRSFQYPFFGDLWSADFLHGPMVRQGVHARKTYLLSLIHI